MSLFVELKRRNVFRVAIAYVVIAWVLAQVADLAFDNFGSPDWVSKSVLFMLALGLPLAIFFAWAFEMTPEGIKKEKDVDRSESITPQTGRKIDYVIIGVLVIAVGFLISDKYQTSDPDGPETSESFEVVETDTSRLSIAVLPFDNRSALPEDEYFTEGIHDDLLTTIAKIGSMKVISRTSVMQYKDTTKKIPEIAKELGVANILEGGIQRSGDQVRINVQLIDAKTDEHLWAETYDRHLTAENLFAIQSEVSNAIAQALQATLSPGEEKRINAVPTQSLEAYEAYMLGRQLWVARTAESTAESVNHFQRAIDLDPNFAQAWAGLSDAYRHSVLYVGVPRSEAFPKAEFAVRKALELDDQLGEAHAALGGLLGNMNDDVGAEKSLLRAIELNPNYSAAYNWLGLAYRRRGDEDKAQQTFKDGLQVDPLSPVLHTNVIFGHELAGQFDELRHAAERLIELSPNHPFGYDNMASYNEFALGRLDASLRWKLKVIEMDSNDAFSAAMLGYTFVDLNDHQSAAYWFDHAASIRSDSLYVSIGRFLMAISTGDIDTAIVHARKADELDPGYVYNSILLLELAMEDLAKDKGDDALNRYQSTFPTLIGAHGFTATRLNSYVVTHVVHLLRETGATDQADDLLAQLKTVIDTAPLMGFMGYGPEKAVAQVLAGNNEAALVELANAVESGWRRNWWYYFNRHPFFEPLRGDPEFQRLRSVVEADIAEQLENVRRMEASGELPTNWAQPPTKTAAPPPT